MGAAFSGLIAAREIVGGTVAGLLSRKGVEIQIVPAEDPSSWPEPLRRKMPANRTEPHARA
jgi:hypothetical protein